MKKGISFLVVTCCAGILLGAGGQEEERAALLRHRDGKSDSDSDHRYSGFLDAGVKPEDIGISTEGAGPAEIKSELSVFVQQKRDTLFSILEKDKLDLEQGESGVHKTFSGACTLLLAGSLDYATERSVVIYIPKEIASESFKSCEARIAARDAKKIFMLCCAVSTIDAQPDLAYTHVHTAVHALQKDARRGKSSYVWTSEDQERLRALLTDLRARDHTA